MSLETQPLTSIKTRRRRKHILAEALITIHHSHLVAESAKTKPSSVRIVCISDTHNKQPALPLGDVLIHAGDLTENGSFDEVQDALTWLSSQPHKYKIFVAGNHDVLLDDAFLAKYPERRYGQSKTKEDLDWGTVIYLEDSVITVEISTNNDLHDCDVADARSLTIFGSPWTPQYGASAFQYHPNSSEHWETIFSSLERKPDIIVTHGPPRHHLDRRDFHRAGCPYLSEEICRIRPRLHIFGHIHASYGREDIVLDGPQKIYEEVITGLAGWASLVWMTLEVASARVKAIFGIRDTGKMTTFANAAVVGGPNNELRNAPFVIDV